MAAETSREAARRSLVSRLRDRGADDRPHFVLCGNDALVYTLAEELSNAGHQLRITVIVPRDLRSDVPDLSTLPVKVIRSERLDEGVFQDAELAGADALALVMQDDVVNLHAALCAQAVEPALRLVIRMVNTSLGSGVRKLFASCAVLSDAAMAAPAFVAAALGEVAPTHFRHAGRRLYVARRADVPEKAVVCALTGTDGAGLVQVLPADPAKAAARPADLVLAEATGRPVGQTVAAQQIVRTRRRRRPFVVATRAITAALNRKLGIAVLVTLVITMLAGAMLANADTKVHGFWPSTYVTLLTALGTSEVDLDRTAVAQVAQLVLALAGVALLPLITAAVVEGMVNARLALSNGRVRRPHTDHIVLVGLGTVGTRVMRQLVDLGLEVVAIDRRADARGVEAAEQLGVPVIVGDAGREETLRSASVETCKALVVLSTDDVTNLKAALNARAIRPDARVVLRLFDSDFARRVQTAFNINISRSVFRLVAPAFAAAMLDRDVVVTIPVDRHALLVASVRVMPGSPLDGGRLRAADRPLSVRVIGWSAPDSDWVDWSPDLGRTLSAGDQVLVVGRRAGLNRLLADSTELQSTNLDA